MASTAKSSKFPLWLHAKRGWTKKIHGKMYYFGQDKVAAQAEYVRVREDLEAGRTPRPKSDDSPTLRELFNIYLTARRRDVESGELGSRSWGDYHKTCERLIGAFGAGRRVDDLRPEDFGKFRATAT